MACIRAGRRRPHLYACTATEVLIFSPPEFQQTGYVSFPALNDVHHVTPTSDDNLLVANPGLDTVVKFTLPGEVLSEWPRCLVILEALAIARGAASVIRLYRCPLEIAAKRWNSSMP
jgi:hypothetical protein